MFLGVELNIARWLGHAAVYIELSKTKLIIDPYLSRNPLCPVKPEDLGDVDAILVTHSHEDHIGDAVEISVRTHAPIVGTYDVVKGLEEKNVVRTIGMNIGGSTRIGNLDVIIVPAIHTGNASGFIIKGENFSIYHAGDTFLFSDMKLLAELYKPDLAFLPIGGYYTMGLAEAAKAALFIKPRIVVPIHYNTFKEIQQDPYKFVDYVHKEDPFIKVLTPEPGERINLDQLL